MMPLFSIIIPSYNQKMFLEETVRSVINQTFKDWELLIVDDESTDGSLALSYRLADEHPNIQVFEKKNGGLSSSRNHGIRNSNGEYIYWIDADDRMLPDLLAKAASVIKKSKPDIVQFGYRYLLNSDGRIMHSVYPQNRLTFPEIFTGSPGSSHSFIVRKDMINKSGFFDEQLKSVEDWDLWIRIAKCNPIVEVLPFTLVDYRQHELSMSRNYVIMYESFQKVAFSAVKWDCRILMNTDRNRNYEYDMLPVVKKSLLRFTAMAIMQDKVDLAADLFKMESEKYQWCWQPSEFREMNCYLTFRYRYSKEDLRWVFQDVMPLFNEFFQKIGCTKHEIAKRLVEVFCYHLQNSNVVRFGLAGQVFNKLNFYPGY